MQLMKLLINYFLIKLPISIFGELKNTSNNFDKRLMRIFSRTPLKFFIYWIYLNLFKKKNIKKKELSGQEIFVKSTNYKKAINDLNKNGIHKKFILKKNIINQILFESNKYKFFINRDKNSKIFLKQKKNNDKIYVCRFLNPHKKIKIINKIANNKFFLTVAREYLQTEPLIQSTQIWWTFSHMDENKNYINPPGNEFGYHYDVDDFKFLKLFFYLSDVGKYDGPHFFIKKNGPKKINEYLNRRINDKIIQNQYKDRIISITGGKGTGFIEDTTNYHKGSNPKDKNSRGVLQIIYGVSKW